MGTSKIGPSEPLGVRAIPGIAVVHSSHIGDVVEVLGRIDSSTEQVIGHTIALARVLEAAAGTGTSS